MMKTGETEIETEEERAEREAIAAEACGQLPRYEIGVQVFPVTSTGERLHDESSPIAQIRPSPNGWEYRMEGFTQWRGEELLAPEAEIEQKLATLSSDQIDECATLLRAPRREWRERRE
jgi:hypothetical protein